MWGETQAQAAKKLAVLSNKLIWRIFMMARQIVDEVVLCTKERCKKVEALFDTGAVHSYVSDKVAEELGYERYKTPRLIPLAVEKREGEEIGEIPGVRVTIGGCEMPHSHTFGVLRGLRHEAVIGMDIMEPYQIRLDHEKGKPYLEKCPPEVELV
jgi:predicted aspartyl protease